jgi:hypothetical protein
MGVEPEDMKVNRTEQRNCPPTGKSKRSQRKVLESSGSSFTGIH